MFEYKKTKVLKKIYYFIKNDNLYSNFDWSFSVYLGLPLEEYRNILINNFNGERPDKKKLIESSGDIYFANEIDCQNAVDYLNKNLDSFLVTKKLTE